MKNGLSGQELWSADGRARLEALAVEIERVRAAVPQLSGTPRRGLTAAERPLDWTLVAAVAATLVPVLHRAGVIATPVALLLTGNLKDPAAIARLVARGAGQATTPPFDGAPLTWPLTWTLTWEVVRLALPPFLRTACEQRGETLDSGACPNCRGIPDLAVLSGMRGARTLICSLCDGAWQFDRVRCPFCGNTSQSTLFYLGGGPRGLTVRVCDVCRIYLKTVDRRELPGDEPPLLLRMLTVDMDLAARAAGYHQGATLP